MPPPGRAATARWQHATRHRSQAAARRAVPAVLHDATAQSPQLAGALCRPLAWTTTGTGLFQLRTAGVHAVLRLTAAGGPRLRREADVLASLNRLPLTSAVRAVLPQRLAAGALSGFEYAVDVELPGVAGDLLVGQPTWEGIRRDAFAVIDAVHRAGSVDTRVGDDLLRRWVDAPIEIVRRACTRLPGLASRARLDQLGALLRSELAGRDVRTSWVHGDFWAGNLLVGPGALVTGVVDWDLAAPDELPVHDYLHLLLYRLRSTTGRDLGAITRDLLADGPGSAEITAAAGAWEWAFPDGSPPRRVLVLLHWLRHVAVVSLQQQSYVAHSVRAWDLRNIHPVLRSL